jgi:FkbM family methyltransferase
MLIKQRMAFCDVRSSLVFCSLWGARLVGPAGKVFCFEPLAANFRQIRHNAMLNGFTNIQVIETALGSVDARLPFWTSAEPTWGKLVSTGSIPYKLTGEINVPVRRLDGIVSDGGLPAPHVIKIDVQGAEIEVLSNAIEPLHTHPPWLLIELHDTNNEVAKFLSEMDYQAVALGECAAIANAHWNADVVAIPAEEEWPAGLPQPKSRL